jgi:hypothetical protein
MVKTTEYKLKVIFIAPLLGSQASIQVATEYVAKKNGFTPEDDELAMLPDVLDKGTTVFHKMDDGTPAIMNYHLMGFLKEAGRVLNGLAGDGVKNLRSKVGSYVSVQPRIIPLIVPAGVKVEYLERPLRAETPLGPRVALARSEMLPEGTTFKAMLSVINKEIDRRVLEDLLDYGYNKGMCQWRSSGAYGNFRYELTVDGDS